MRKPVNAPLTLSVNTFASCSRLRPLLPPSATPPQSDEPPGRGNKSSKPAPTHPDIRPLLSPFLPASRVATFHLLKHYSMIEKKRRIVVIGGVSSDFLHPLVFSSLEDDPAKKNSPCCRWDVFPSERSHTWTIMTFQYDPRGKILMLLCAGATSWNVALNCEAGPQNKHVKMSIFFKKCKVNVIWLFFLLLCAEKIFFNWGYSDSDMNCHK